MVDSHSKIDVAASEASAEAAAKVIADKLAEKPVSIVADKAAKKSLVSDKKPAPAARKAPVADKRLAQAAAPAQPSADRDPQASPDAVTTTTTNSIKQLKDKIMENTINTAGDFTAKAKETVADMQTRMKTAYDKGTELTADVTAFHKGNFDAMVEAGKVFAAGMQDLGRTAVEDARTAAETVTNDVKTMAAVKSPTDLFQLQGEIARRNLDTIVARTSKNAEVMMKLANDMFAPLSTRASVAMERLNQAA